MACCSIHLQLHPLSQFQARSREPRIAEKAADGEDDAQEGADAPDRQGTALLHAAGRLHPRRVGTCHAEPEVVKTNFHSRGQIQGDSSNLG